MTKAQTSMYNMHLSVIAICDANETVWEEKDFFASPYNRFIALHNQIDAIRLRLNSDPAGFTDDKNAKREALLTLVKLFSWGLHSYAIGQGLHAMKKSVHKTEAVMEKLSDDKLMSFAEFLTAQATPVVASLTDQGITAAKVTELTNARTAFLNSVMPMREAREDKLNANQDLKNLFDQCALLLAKELDHQAKVFAHLAPGFYQSYTNARRITDPQTRTRALIIHLADQDSNQPLANVDLFFSTGLQRKTSNKGNAWVQNLVEGEASMTCRKLGYAEKTISFHVIDGETTRLELKLERA